MQGHAGRGAVSDAASHFERAVQALGLLLGAMAALCLVGCGQPGPKLMAYRDQQVQPPPAKGGVRPFASDRGLCIINVRRDGSIWTSQKSKHAGAGALEPLITEAKAKKGTLILRCDGRSRWKDVRPLVVILARLGVARFWFCVETGGEAYLDLDIPPPCDEDRILTEIWVRVTTKREAGKEPQPQLLVDQTPMRDWSHFHTTLRRYAMMPGARSDPVVLAPDDESQFGWVIHALDLLRLEGFRDFTFPEPVGEGIEPEVDVPIEDIPIAPSSEESTLSPTLFPGARGQAPLLTWEQGAAYSLTANPLHSEDGRCQRRCRRASGCFAP